jgi:hypothetical protein
MKSIIISYERSTGWAEALPAQLDSENTLVVIFGGAEYFDIPQPFEELKEQFPSSHIIGCSTAGEINGASISDSSLTVAVVRFEKTQLRSFSVPLSSSEHSYQTADSLAQQLDADDLKSVFVLSEGLHVNGSELVRGFNERLSDSVVITGGLAADGDRFERTWVIHDGKPTVSYVSAVAFYGGDVCVGHGSKGGWDIFGPERKVTRSKGNVLFELDGKPALDLYKEYLGEMAADLPASALRFPLSLREDMDSEKKLVRTILAVSEEDNSMTFAGDIPEGSLARLMHTNVDRLIDGAEEAALMTKERMNETDDVFAIAISCVGRRIVMGESTEDEIEATLDIFPTQTQQIGFYSYGELSPYATGSCDLHNQTMTLTTFAEK